MMRAGCHDCRRAAEHAMRIWDDEAKPGQMVAVCAKCADKRVTAEIVKGLAEDRPYEPEGVFVEFSPNDEAQRLPETARAPREGGPGE
jgi:hypothetical protein